jgi:AAA15 family ATPase/GTPase
MQLTIKNLGPIKKGEIDLSKRFYVFVGYNNSGKTYVSQLLWAIFNEKIIEKFSFSQSTHFTELVITEDDHFEITQGLIDSILNQFANYLKKEVVPDLFNVSKNHLILKDFSIEFVIKRDEIQNLTQEVVVQHLQVEKNNKEITGINRLFISKEKDSFCVTFEEKKLSEIFDDFLEDDFLERGTTILNKKISKESFFVMFILNLILNKTHEPFFLPSNRMIYLVFYHYLYSVETEKRERISKIFGQLLEKKERGEDFNSETLSIEALKSFYTGPTKQLFDRINGLNENAKTHTHYEHLMLELAKIIGGDIIMHKSLGIAPLEFYLKMPQKEEELEMYLSSSSVNQLNTLYLYLKYWAEEKNNFLLIDEPEENLHPKHQLALLNVLLSYANENNNRVLITTHSPILADMVNNYHYMAFLKAKKIPLNFLREKYSDINLDMNLSIEEMGIYFFDGEQIHKYEMDDYGVFFEDFYYEIKKTKDISELLTDQIYELRNEEGA